METNIQKDSGGGMVSSIMGWYNYLMVDLRDPRVDSWPLMSSIWPTITICALYVYVVKVAGPRYMKDKEPYQIKGLMLGYNLFQTVFSLWMFLEGWGFYMTGEYNWVCQPVDYSDSPLAKRALNLAWWYYFSKFIDLADSIFFVARKKFGHLSPLCHVPLLLPGCLWSWSAEVSLVEEVSDHHADGSVCLGLPSCSPASLLHL